MHIVKTYKKGMAMIELIFALVILGITMASIPMLISQSTKSNFVAFQQESIAIAAAQTSALLTYAWDENNTLNALAANAILNVPPVANVADGELINRTPFTNISPAVTNTRLRNFSAAPVLSATAWLGQDGGEPDDDIDDFTNANLGLANLSINAVNAGEYIDVNVTLNTNVTYATDDTNYAIVGVIDAPRRDPIGITNGTSDNFSNIKNITVTLTSVSNVAELADKTIVLNAFMCNIGGVNIPTVGNF